ncbi:MAG: PIN domain-containing protein [Deltaproteobacteria bacterium]|nr:PIN domain-containing protein [Deltaproteobacteria bacterium]
MIVLVDTSVWIEFFKKSSFAESAQLEMLIEERRVATCLPIRAEVLSGQMSSQNRLVVSQAFQSMHQLNPDWNKQETWEKIIEFAHLAWRNGFGIPGITDRMIALASKETGAALWTLDKKLKKLAETAGITNFEA